MVFHHLVSNEISKMVRKRRYQVVLLIVFALVALFSYGEQQAAKALTQQLGTSDWHVQVQEEITRDLNELQSPFLSSGEKAAISAAIKEAEYELQHNVNPNAPGAPSFMRGFIDDGTTLLIPMLVVVIASDMVSSEMSGGTIKMLLTRGVSRFQVLLGKVVALFLLVALLMATIAVAAYVVSGLFFGYQGFNLPILFGFHTNASGYVNLSHVYTMALWRYLVMAYGLGFVSSISVAALSLMVSTLVRSTASGIGIMMAALIAGALLANLASTWTQAKYLPMVNLALTGYLNGSPPPINGMTFTFSLADLGVSSLLALVVSFVVFIRRDMMG